jgi:hypothetical protein
LGIRGALQKLFGVDGDDGHVAAAMVIQMQQCSLVAVQQDRSSAHKDVDTYQLGLSLPIKLQDASVENKIQGHMQRS